MIVKKTTKAVCIILPLKKYLYDKLASFNIHETWVWIEKPPKDINIIAITSLNLMLELISDANPWVISKNPLKKILNG